MAQASAKEPRSSAVKTQYFTATSLDGFIAEPDDSLDWLFPLGDISDTSYPGFIREVGALAMGSATYRWMLRHVVGPDADHPQPWPYAQPPGSSPLARCRRCRMPTFDS